MRCRSTFRSQIRCYSTIVWRVAYICMHFIVIWWHKEAICIAGIRASCCRSSTLPAKVLISRHSGTIKRDVSRPCLCHQYFKNILHLTISSNYLANWELEWLRSEHTYTRSLHSTTLINAVQAKQTRTEDFTSKSRFLLIRVLKSIYQLPFYGSVQRILLFYQFAFRRGRRYFGFLKNKIILSAFQTENWNILLRFRSIPRQL